MPGSVIVGSMRKAIGKSASSSSTVTTSGMSIGTSTSRLYRRRSRCLKKIVRLASVFPSPPFRSSDFAGPRRPRLYGFHTGTGSLSNRKGRGGERVDGNGKLVEREEGGEVGIENPWS